MSNFPDPGRRFEFRNGSFSHMPKVSTPSLFLDHQRTKLLAFGPPEAGLIAVAMLA